MPIKEAIFIKSAPDLQFCPETSLPEICFAGRSNVGKSSLINALTKRKNLAKTSNVPGKTRAMNYFLIDQTWHLVDLPGYGYAKISKKEQARWGVALNEYMLKREQLRLVVLLIDIRHKAMQSDIDFMFWMATKDIPFILVLSKADKIGVTKQQSAEALLKKTIKDMNIDTAIYVMSSNEKKGIDDFYDFLRTYIE
jgi:GTP-binding protein